MASTKLEDDPRVVEFVQVARRFCDLIDSRESIPKPEFVDQCAEVLGFLYGHAMRLISLGLETQDTLSYPSHDTWNELFDSLENLFGEDNPYRKCFYPYPPESGPEGSFAKKIADENVEPTNTCLADDLADIYRDLRLGLDVFGQSEELTLRAVWSWWFFFQAHWGHHCTSAMHPLRELVERYHEDD